MPLKQTFSYISQRHFLVLMILLLSIILTTPFFLQSGAGNVMLAVVSCLTLLVAIYEMRHSRRDLITSSVLAIILILARLLQILSSNVNVEVAGDISSTLFVGYIIYVIAKYILTEHRISTNKIYGALCIYILLGVFFLNIYHITELLIPGSFRFTGIATSPSVAVDRFNMGYFSFSILTTTGTTDLIPTNLYVSSIVLLEQTVGVLFIASLVAQFVTSLSLSYTPQQLGIKLEKSPIHFKYDIISKITKHNFLILLLLICTILIIAPYFLQTRLRFTLLQMMLATILITSLCEMHHTRRELFIALAISLFATVTHIINCWNQTLFPQPFEVFTIIIFIGGFTIIMGRHAFRGYDVNQEKIYGALAVYLLLGILFTEIYYFVELLEPGSFSNMNPLIPAGSVELDRLSLVYFSFANLTTMGTTPLGIYNPYMKSLAVIEQMTGIFYIAALVARLVASYSFSQKLQETQTHLEKKHRNA